MILQKNLKFRSLEMQFPAVWASKRVLFMITFIDQWTQFLKKLMSQINERCTLKTSFAISMTLNIHHSSNGFVKSNICYSFLYNKIAANPLTLIFILFQKTYEKQWKRCTTLTALFKCHLKASLPHNFEGISCIRFAVVSLLPTSLRQFLNEHFWKHLP